MTYTITPMEALPLPVMAGVRTRWIDPVKHRQLGSFLDILGSIAGAIIPGLFGSHSQSSAQSAQIESMRLQMQSQADLTNAMLRASSEAMRYQTEGQIGVAQIGSQTALTLAQIESDRVERANQLQLLAEQARADAEARAIDKQYQAVLSAQRQQRISQSEQLSSQLTDSAQMGIYGLSSTMLAESGSTARSYPKAATYAVIGVVAAVVAGTVLTSRGGRGSGRTKRRRGVRGRRARTGPAGSSSLAPLTTTGATT